jgi:branched-chain amino acid transport system permease protein
MTSSEGSLIADLAVAGLITGGIYALIAIGLNLQYGLLRIMNIAHGEFLMVGAYLTYALRMLTGASPLWFLPVSAGAMFALGLGIHRLIFRRLAATSASAEVFEERSLLIGFGLMFVLQNAALLIWGADLRGYDYLAQPIQYGGVIVTANRLLVFAVVVAISGALMLALRVTMLGKAVRGMLQSPLGAMLVGVDTRRLHPICFALGLALAGAAGSLLSMIFEVSPSMGESYTVTALIVITLGGLGHVVGSFVGALLLGLVESFGMYFTSPSLKALLSYGVLVLVLLIRPKGLVAR